MKCPTCEGTGRNSWGRKGHCVTCKGSGEADEKRVANSSASQKPLMAHREEGDLSKPVSSWQNPRYMRRLLAYQS